MEPIVFPLSYKRAKEDALCSTDSVRRDQPESTRRDLVLEGGSFKTKLIRSSNTGEWSGFGSGNPLVSIDDDDIVYGEGEFGPSMKFSIKLKEKLAKPWFNAVILKIMGRPHSLNFMLQKLRQKWSLVGHWQLTDLEDGYFVARFQFYADLVYVLTGGPCVIVNQYLVVQKWRPNFVPGDEPIRKMPIWLRISKLPLDWVEVNLLWKIGGLLGKTVKVDPISKAQTRGRYARICVEIDITKPLKSLLPVDDKLVDIEYENLSMICFKCGKVGHVQDNCKE
ncbi:hypothetical protein ACOSQ2_023743 [Xanthoceras sorbifolium]